MRIAFLDTLDYDYTIDSAYQRPLGGSSSAVCYLAEALTALGQDVFLLNKTTTPGRSRGVIVLPFAALSARLRQSLDVLVVVNLAGQGTQLRQVLSPSTRLILWTGHAHDQPAMQPLSHAQERSAYDGFVLVSQWQRQQFQRCFDLDLSRTQVLRNAISPAFRDRFPADRSILSYKASPPVLAYTSTPFRGLNLLLDLFPSLRQALPGTRLKVFSSMKVYNLSDADHEELYRQCQETEGVEYIGSLPQPQLARELESVTALVYPNTFAETSCIAVMEAMAIGCQVITSDLGALAETTAGFAQLIPLDSDLETYKSRFVTATIDLLKADPDGREAQLRQQVDFANAEYTWTVRASEWLEWLGAAAQSQPRSIALSAYDAVIAGEYDRAVAQYQRAIDLNATDLQSHWDLGLVLLLQDEGDSAQEVWMLALLNASEPTERSLAQLSHTLQAERQRQRVLGQTHLAARIQNCLQQLEQNH